MPDLITAKGLREQRHKLVKDARAVAEKAEAEKRDVNTEEAATWNRIMGHVDKEGKRQDGEIDTLKRRIDRLEAVETEERDTEKPIGDKRVGRDDFDGKKRPGGDGAQEVTEEHRALAMQAWCRHQLDHDLTEEQLEACKLVRLRPDARRLTIPMLSTAGCRAAQQKFRSVHPSQAMDAMANFQCRALTSGSGAGGGYLVPPESLIRQLEVNMLAFGGVRQVAETLRTTSGERLSWPTADDTSNTGVQLGESTTIGSSVDPTFGKIYWDAYKFSSKAILVPYELLEDSAFQLVELLGQMLGERLGRITNTKFTTGTGAATPKGIVTGATLFAAASATAIAADDLIKLVHSVDPAYRMGAGFMMHDAIMLILRLLKDGNGQYMFQTGLANGSPDRLLSYPITNNQDMDSTVASGKKSILFGQLSKYKIRSVASVRIYRLQERYRDTDQDGFIAFLREDGNLLTAGTAPVKYLGH